MNNNQFRRLVVDNPDGQNEGKSTGKASAPPSSLGAKKSSFMPMTPRTVKGGIDVDFARQVRERNAASQPTKKFKTAAPKGVKFGAGYTDRAKARADAEEDEADDKADRIKALEEEVKRGTISQEMFESMRDGITGGDIGSTHLVKGLDRRLLERVRRGEDVLGTGSANSDAGPPPDVDEELEKLEEKEVEAVKRDKTQKKGEMAPPPPVAGVKRSRDEIMAELKAQRKAAAEAKATPALDLSKWSRVGEKKSKTEIDHKGREVLITVDEDGTVKKKVRKVPGQNSEQERSMVDASKPVLGADAAIPEPPTQPEEDSDDDIFEGVGTEYNPLGGDEENDDSDDDDSEEGEAKDKPAKPAVPKPAEDAPRTEKGEEQQAARRNYFKDTPSTVEEPTQDRLAGVQDLLKKASKMETQRSEDPDDDSNEGDAEQKARLKRRAEMLAQQDRDLEDMDLGFGGSRDDDGGDEEDGKKVKLSQWKGAAGNDDDGWEKGDKEGGKKKRKSKKRKGDASNMSDIMRVIEGRKGGGGG